MISGYISNTTEEGHDDHDEVNIPDARIVAAVLSLLLGLTSSVSNVLLLLTLHKDPLRCFQRRATTVFIQGLAAIDFLAGVFVQPMYASSLLLDVTGKKVPVLYRIALIGSHVATKISILTLVAIAVDRLLAITLPWKYNVILTRKRAAVTNMCIWLFIGAFEATHLEPSLDQVLHEIDLHLQTTIPIVGLLIISVATYLAFRRYSRNAVFAAQSGEMNRFSRIRVRNLHFEKKIMLTILLILLVVLVSLMPYLIVQKISNKCNHSHEEHEEGNDEESNCNESKEYAIAKVFSVCLLGFSCALNPALYAWRIPHYRQSLKMVANSSRCRRRGRARVLAQDYPIPSMFRLMADGNSPDERESVLAWNSHPVSNINVQFVKPMT